VRFGALAIIATGAVIMVGCVIVAMSGIAFSNFLIANILVGVGWNFCFIGGTTLLTTTYRQSERAKVQGAHDFLCYSVTAMTSGVSGVVLAVAGWEYVNLLALPLILVVIAAVAWLYLSGHGTASPVAARKP
jgi:MFS family permease